MPALRWKLTYEASFKLHSGADHETFILFANNLDDGVRKLARAVVAWSRKNEAVFIGAVLKDATQNWQPVIAGIDVPN